MVNRDRHDIVFEILQKSMQGKKKTELMSEVGLSFSQTKQYLDMLFSKGLIEVDARNRLKTTKKGAEFLKKCEQCPLFKWVSKGKLVK